MDQVGKVDIAKQRGIEPEHPDGGRVGRKQTPLSIELDDAVMRGILDQLQSRFAGEHSPCDCRDDVCGHGSGQSGDGCCQIGKDAMASGLLVMRWRKFCRNFWKIGRFHTGSRQG